MLNGCDLSRLSRIEYEERLRDAARVHLVDELIDAGLAWLGGRLAWLGAKLQSASAPVLPPAENESALVL